MRVRLLAMFAVTVLAFPTAGRAQVVPDAVPDFPLFGPQAARGTELLTTVTDPTIPTPKTVDGDISDWTGEITRYAGTAIYSRGEYVYQDYLMDDWGADDGTDAARATLTDQANTIEPRTYRAEVLSQALGEQFGVECDQTLCAVANYGNVEDSSIRGNADIEEVRIAADPSRIYLLVRTAGMDDAGSREATLVTIGRDPEESFVAPGGALTQGEYAFLVAGDRVVRAEANGLPFTGNDAASVSDITVATNPSGYVNATEIGIPRAIFSEWDNAPSLSFTVATGVLNDAGDDLARVRKGNAKSDLLNVAFRSDEPVRVWMDHDQALALHDGDIRRYAATVDPRRLESGYTETAAPSPGYWERIYVSQSRVNREREIDSYFQGAFQHYGVFLPSKFRPGTRLPTTWWTHYRGGHAHDAAAWVPGLLRQLGERRQNIMIFPSARGTSSWYVGRGHEDFLEVWDDTMRNLPIDPDRVYMSGYSMGGFASWLLPLLYPDRFAGSFPTASALTQGAFLAPGIMIEPANGGDTEAELLYNIVENARNVPYVIYHGTDDELAPVTGVATTVAKLTGLGYRHRFYLFPGYEHYTAAIIDDWREAAKYLSQFTRDPDPAHVTYRVWPALARAVSTVSTPNDPTTGSPVDLGYRFDRAYWTSELTLRDGDSSNVAAMGEIDAVTLGRGDRNVIAVPEAGTAKQTTPYVMTGLRWLDNGPVSPRNRFSATVTNLAAERLDLARMGLSTARPLSGSLTTDGATELRLAGSWGEPPVVQICDVGAGSCTESGGSYSNGILSIGLPKGVFAIQVRPAS